jgi:hypothetical protein
VLLVLDFRGAHDEMIFADGFYPKVYPTIETRPACNKAGIIADDCLLNYRPFSSDN